MTVLEKSGLYLAVCLIVILLFFILFGTHGLMDYRKLKIKEDKVISQSRKVSEKNRALINEVEKLKTDAEYIKHVAKHEYEMAEENEIIIKHEDAK